MHFYQQLHMKSLGFCGTNIEYQSVSIIDEMKCKKKIAHFGFSSLLCLFSCLHEAKPKKKNSSNNKYLLKLQLFHFASAVNMLLCSIFFLK